MFPFSVEGKAVMEEWKLDETGHVVYFGLIGVNGKFGVFVNLSILRSHLPEFTIAVIEQWMETQLSLSKPNTNIFVRIL